MCFTAASAADLIVLTEHDFLFNVIWACFKIIFWEFVGMAAEFCLFASRLNS